jgi:hypothetical protein
MDVSAVVALLVFVAFVGGLVTLTYHGVELLLRTPPELEVSRELRGTLRYTLRLFPMVGLIFGAGLLSFGSQLGVGEVLQSYARAVGRLWLLPPAAAIACGLYVLLLCVRLVLRGRALHNLSEPENASPTIPEAESDPRAD